MPSAESILCKDMCEVHPGACGVKQLLSYARLQPLSVSRCISDLFMTRYTNRVEPRISPPLSLEAGFLYP